MEKNTDMERIRDEYDHRQATEEMREIGRGMRFAQLMDLAEEGNEEAAADLWWEYGYEFKRGES